MESRRGSGAAFWPIPPRHSDTCGNDLAVRGINPRDALAFRPELRNLCLPWNAPGHPQALKPKAWGCPIPKPIPVLMADSRFLTAVVIGSRSSAFMLFVATR